MIRPRLPLSLFALSAVFLVSSVACVEPEAASTGAVSSEAASGSSGTEEADAPQSGDKQAVNPLAASGAAEGEGGGGDDSIPEDQRDDGSDKAADPNKAPPSAEFEDMRKKSGNAPGSGPRKDDGRKWTSVGTAKLGSALTISAKIGDAKGASVGEKSPLRVFLGPLVDSPLEGYMLFMGAGDKPVLMGQSKSPGVYDKELFRGTKASSRSDDGVVTLSVPASAFPKKDLKVWPGGGGEVTVNGVVIPAAEKMANYEEKDPDTPKPETDVAAPTSPTDPMTIPFVTLKN